MEAAGIEPASAFSRRCVRRPNVAAGLGNERTRQTDRQAGGPVLVARQWCAGTFPAASSSRQAVFACAVVFIPAGTAHRTRNASDSPVRVHAMFPSEVIGIEYLERNPAPGTENDPAQPPVSLDVRALMGS